MKIKRLITLIETLALTGLVSVGFSSWLVIETNPAVIAGLKANVEDVFSNYDYLIIKNMSFSDYYYNNGGGFYPDYTYTSDVTQLTDTGILEFDVIIDLNKYRTDLKTSPSSINLDLYLGYSDSHNGQAIGNFLDIITRSLPNNGFSSSFTYLYDNVAPVNEPTVVGTEVSYTAETPYPNIDRKFTFNNINTVNKIYISAVYSFTLNGGFTAQDNASLNEGGVPFRIHATLNNA